MIVTDDNIHDAVFRIRQDKIRAADTETFGLKYTDLPFSIIVGTRTEAFYFNLLDYATGERGLSPESIALLKPVFEDSDVIWFLHNAKFDMHKLAKYGINIHGTVWDTKTHARILKNNLLDYSLETLCKDQINKKSSAVDEYIEANGLFTRRKVPGKQKIVKDLHYNLVPFDIIYDYGIKDVNATMELGLNQMKAYEESPSLHRVRDNEVALIKAIYEMEKEGVAIDPSYVMAAWEHEEKQIQLSKAKFAAAYGIQYDDSSKNDLVEILKSEGETISFTAAGNPCLDKDHLKLMSSPAAELIKEIRHYEKRISSFYSTFMEFRDPYNVIHPNADPAGTETGRFSMSEPNLQQLSKDDKAEDGDFTVRGCFVARRGFFFAQFDYSQQEYRILADYAKETQLIDRIAKGHDVHQATADLVGITRNEAKTVNFAILYGAGAAKLALMLKISLADAKKLIRRYFAAMPAVEMFIERVKGTGASRGSIFNWFGRRYNIAKREWAYILPNHLIQGSGADVCKTAILKVHNYLKLNGLKSRIIMTVHDSIILEISADEVHIIENIKRLMENSYEPRNGVILKVDVEISSKSLSKKDLKKYAA